ncbi:MAG TPA: o-succinylbenzoate--CoA ligase [Actinomycetes bacterium]|nr:o-succinylbenzoate--CoA ligase [Actinomycetes bacterium]
MTSPRLLALDAPAGADEVERFLPHLRAALVGSGQPVMPLPQGPDQVRQRLVALADFDRPVEYDDIALAVPTSGSTGEPKLALLSRAALMASARATHLALGGSGQWLLALPTTHIAGLQVLIRSIDADTSPCVADVSTGFRPAEFVTAAAALQTGPGQRRYTALVPTQLRRLLDAGDAAIGALSGFDAVLLGGSAVTPPLSSLAQDAGVNVVQTYGMTETCGGCVYDGVPLDGVQIDLVDERIVIEGPVLFSGYRRDATLTAQTLRDGALWTYDRGAFDGHGRLEVLGRLDDVVISGGVNIDPATVESALASHPSVAEVAVVGVPDSEWGERLVAVAVVNAPLSLPELRAHARTQLPVAALPRELVLVGAIPRLGSGKPDRTALRLLSLADGVDPARP